MPTLIAFLPLLVGAAALLLTQASAEGSRGQSVVGALTICLLSVLGMLLLLDGFSLTNIVLLSLAMLASTVVASPLLDRTRFNGIALAASIAGIAIVGFTFNLLYTCLPEILKAGLLHVVLISALVLGLIGSMILPLHPARFTKTSIPRWQEAPPGLLFTGWIFLALVFTGVIWLMRPLAFAFPAPIFVAALIASITTIVFTRRFELADSLHKSGEAAVAGILITTLAPVGLEGAMLLGIVAALGVLRSEVISHALRIDDPTHLVGALLIPSLLGLLLPGLLSTALLAPYLMWCGAALLLGLVLAVVLWPLTMLFFGFALPKRAVKKGR